MEIVKNVFQLQTQVVVNVVLMLINKYHVIHVKEIYHYILMNKMLVDVLKHVQLIYLDKDKLMATFVYKNVVEINMVMKKPTNVKNVKIMMKPHHKMLIIVIIVKPPDVTQDKVVTQIYLQVIYNVTKNNTNKNYY